ncbi:MAG: type IV pilus secretin PilQ family protein [Pseudomonadales bacterium]|nr:type IV pilus secretin PilQ family protein [Pseudomonadales bacterium]
MKIVKKVLVATVPLLLPLWAMTAQSATLKDISFASLPGDRFEVRMDFDAKPPEPKSYTIDKPARLVMDFEGTESALKEKKYPLSFGSAKSANVLSDGGRTRLILNMVQLETYKTRFDGNSFVMTVGNSDVHEVNKKGTSLAERITEDTSGYGSAIKDVDFRRGENGEGKVIIAMSNPGANVNVDDAGDQITVNFNSTQLPMALRRKLDVVDFATPVQSVSSDFSGGNAVFTIKSKGTYDYMAYQTDNQYVVSIKPLTEKEQAEKVQKFSYVGQKLSLNFQDIPVRSVLQLIADFTDLNLVASDTVEGKITLRLDNVPWDQALDLVLKTKGLDKRQVGNVLMVAPAAEIAAREREEIETTKQMNELAPLRTEFLQILYADAKDIYKLLQGGSSGGTGTSGSTKSILTERGTATVDGRTNSIVLTETDAKIQEIRDFIKRVDVPVRQVSIEARIVKATSGFREDLGVMWGLDLRNGDAFLNGSIDNVLSANNAAYRFLRKDPKAGSYIDPDDLELISTPTGADSMVMDLRAQPEEGDPGTFAIGLLGSDGWLSVELSALEKTGKGEVVSQPKVITGDKQKAIIKSGEEIGYQEASSSGATTTAFKEAVLKLEVTPQITPDDRIIMDLIVTKDNIERFVAGIPVISTTELTTRVLVNNGETVVLGGIFENETVNQVKKIPFLGDLPLVGRFFRNTTQSDNKTELLIFVTPRLLQDPLADKR